MKNNIGKGLCTGKGSIQKMAGDCQLAKRLRTSFFGLPSSVSRLRTLDFRLRTFAVFLLSTVFFTSCEDVIDVKLNDENLNLIGIEASITTMDKPTVFLYKTLQVNQDKESPVISGAVVSVSDNAIPANSVTLVEDEQQKGFYRVPQNIDYFGIAGREYTLTIQAEGTTISAKEQLARVEPIDSIRVFPSMRGNKLFLAVYTYGKETPGIGNFYKWDVFVNDSLLTNGQRLAVASDEFVDGNYISGLEVYTDFHNTDKAAEERKINLGDTIYVKHTSISKFAYYFYFQMINQSGTGSLFSVPPANIKSNFTSGDGKPVLGLFTARDVSVSNKVIIDQKIEDQLRKLK